MPKAKPFKSEAEMCARFIEAATKSGAWIAYPETAGWDILLVRKADGLQIGIEAKLALNAKVIAQALPGRWTYNPAMTGPDHRAVLVPASATAGLSGLCDYVGITVISIPGPDEKRYWSSGFSPELPIETGCQSSRDEWHHWCPVDRHKLPDFIPDVEAGIAAPVKLTAWKVKAIKIAVILEHRPVTRKDFKALGIDASRWTDRGHGWLRPTPDGYVATSRVPDFKAQHPKNYFEIEAQKSKWWMGDLGLPPGMPSPEIEPAPKAAAKKPRKPRRRKTELEVRA